jgi:chromosome partitioning protein
VLNIYHEQKEEFLKLSQLADISKIKRHTLTARIKALYNEQNLRRNAGNQILLLPYQTKAILQNSLVNNKNSKIIYIGNLKGGVGKTTISYLLVNTIRLLGLRVCAIDLDVQANLTNQYVKIDEEQPVFYDVIDNNKKIEDVIVKITDNLHIIPSSLRNSLIPKALTMQSPKHHLTWFNNICLNYLRSKYDIIIVDTPPSISTLNSVFCLCLSDNDNIIIPVCADDFSSMGVQMFLDDILEIRKSYSINSDLTISIIMNRFFQTQKNNLEMLLKISNKYHELLSQVVIKDSAKIREFINCKLNINQIKSGKEVYEIISLLLQELNILKE